MSSSAIVPQVVVVGDRHEPSSAGEGHIVWEISLWRQHSLQLIQSRKVERTGGVPRCLDIRLNDRKLLSATLNWQNGPQ